MNNSLSFGRVVLAGVFAVVVSSCGGSTPSTDTATGPHPSDGAVASADTKPPVVDGAVVIDAGSTTTTTIPSTAEAACTAFVQAHCGYLGRCSIPAMRSYFDTEERCRREQMPICLDRFAAPGTLLTPAGLSACTRAVAATACVSAFNGVLPACTFVGSRPTGAPCRYGDQCQSSLCKYPGWFPECGICAVRAKEGEACTQGDGCESGMDCARGASSQNICIRPKSLGATCDRNKDHCATALSCINGVCASQPVLGQTCTADISCTPTQDIECIDGTCTQLTWNQEGGPCGQNPAIRCSAGLECQENRCVPSTYVRTYPRAAECQ